MSFNSTDSDYEQQLGAPAITSSILQDGLILGYGAYLNQNNDTVEEAAIEFDMYQTFALNSILLQLGFDNSGLWYRYVTIPGHVLVAKGLTPRKSDQWSYAEVTKILTQAAKKSESPSVN